MSNIYKISFEEILEDKPVESAVITEDPLETELEHQRLALELDEDSREIDRQSDLVEGLEALRYIASKLDTPSPTEVALFKVAANMAVSGTKNSAQDFLPAMESNKPIALEGFGDKIKETVKAIIAKLIEWWKKIKDFFTSIFKKNKIIDEKVKEAGYKLSSGKIITEPFIIKIPVIMLSTAQVDNGKIICKDIRNSVNNIIKNEIKLYSLTHKAREGFEHSIDNIISSKTEEELKNIIDDYLNNIEEENKKVINSNLEFIGCKRLSINKNTGVLELIKDDEINVHHLDLTLSGKDFSDLNVSNLIVTDIVYQAPDFDIEKSVNKFYNEINSHDFGEATTHESFDFNGLKIKYFNMLIKIFNNIGYTKLLDQAYADVYRFKEAFIGITVKLFSDLENSK